MLTKAIMASIKPETTEALESAPVLAGDVVALITVQPPPVQNWKHLSASHRKVHPPAVQCWLHSSVLDRQVMLHSPPVQICSHLLELHSNNLHPPPVQNCVQLTMDEVQTNVSQPPAVQYCVHSSYGVVAPQIVEHGCGEQAPWLVLLLAKCTKQCKITGRVLAETPFPYFSVQIRRYSKK